MALDALIDVLRRDARADCDAVLAAARAEASRIVAEADARAAGSRAEALAKVERERRADMAKRLGDARRTARRSTLEARQRLLDKVFAAAAADLPAATLGAAYHATLPARVASAIECIGTRAAEVRCGPGLEAIMRGLIAGRPHVSVRASAGIAPGFVVVASDGSVEVDGTLAGDLDRHRAELSIDVLAAFAP